MLDFDKKTHLKLCCPFLVPLTPCLKYVFTAHKGVLCVFAYALISKYRR